MAQPVTYLPHACIEGQQEENSLLSLEHKHEDRSLGPQHPGTKPGAGMHLSNLVMGLGEGPSVEMGRSWNSSARQLTEFIGSSFSERPYLKAKGKGQEEDSVGLLHNPSSLSSIPRIHIDVEDENELHNVVFWSLHTCYGLCTYRYTSHVHKW